MSGFSFGEEGANNSLASNGRAIVMPRSASSRLLVWWEEGGRLHFGLVELAGLSSKAICS